MYIGNRADEFYRYAITSRGSDTPNGHPDWDGKVRFYWDDQKHIQQVLPGLCTAASTSAPSKRSSATLAAAVAGLAAGQAIGVIGANQIHVHGVDGLGFKSGRLEVAAGHEAPPTYIAQQHFRVNFPSWSTQRAENGDCLFSRAPNEVLYADIPETASDYAFAYVPDLPVEVITPNFRISEPFWFGPPAYRIPVGGTYAIPGPVRDKQPDAPSGGSFPGNYWDARFNFFQQLFTKTHRNRASHYSVRWMNLLRGRPLHEKRKRPASPSSPSRGKPGLAVGLLLPGIGSAGGTRYHPQRP